MFCIFDSCFPVFSFASIWNVCYLDDEFAGFFFSALFIISFCFNFLDVLAVLSSALSFDFKIFVDF